MTSSKLPADEVASDEKRAGPMRPNMGSEYMDARSYLTQPIRAPKVKDSDETFHGSNDSDYGVVALQKI